MTRLLERANELVVEGFVIGLALDEAGEETARSNEARQLGDSLGERSGLPVQYVDERFTTAAALQAVREMEGSTRGRRGDVDGFAAARHDLWRLVHITLHLRQGIARLRDAGMRIERASGRHQGGSLQRKLRRALIAYARVLQRGRDAPPQPLGPARAAALAQIGEAGIEQAERLGRLEGGVAGTRPFILVGVVRGLQDLAADWRS